MSGGAADIWALAASFSGPVFTGGRLTSEEAQQYYERYIGPYFTSDGRVDLTVARHAVDAVATELGVASPSADQLYQPAV